MGICVCVGVCVCTAVATVTSAALATVTAYFSANYIQIADAHSIEKDIEY
jgi:hypothetical protein